jgi:tetratricopeptide (TPR) repeat protein
MFDDRLSDPPPSGERRPKRAMSFIVGLVVVNAAFFVIRPLTHGNPCTSWFTSPFDRGIALDLYGDKAAAVAAYTEDLKNNPRDAEALKNRGLDYASLGQLDLAVADLTQALDLHSNDWDVLNDRARVYLQKGAFDLAIADFSRAVTVAPQIWSTWQDRGDAYLAHGDLDAAIADYSHALAAGEQDHVGLAYYPRGIAYLRAGKFDLAKADFALYAAAYPLGTDAAKAGDCASQGSNTGDCALPYPKPSNPDADKLLDAGARALSGCAQD